MSSSKKGREKVCWAVFTNIAVRRTCFCVCLRGKGRWCSRSTGSVTVGIRAVLNQVSTGSQSMDLEQRGLSHQT